MAGQDIGLSNVLETIEHYLTQGDTFGDTYEVQAALQGLYDRINDAQQRLTGIEGRLNELEAERVRRNTTP